jgi:hypothetical protein
MNLQALEQKHKELGEEIERLKQTEGVWLPEEDLDEYWSIGYEGSATFRFNALVFSREHHNVYQNKALAKKAGILQRRANLIIQACLNFDPDFEPDWDDSDQRKYGFYYNHNKCAWSWSDTVTLNDCAAYVSTSAIADKVVAYLNSQEIK